LGLPVDAIVVLLSEAGVRMKSDNLRDDGLRDMQGITYHVFSGEGIKANSNLSFNLSGRPKLGESTLIGSTSGDNLVIGLGVFGVAMIVAGGWLFLRTRSRKAAEENIQAPTQVAAVDRMGATQDDADTIMDAIIALDDQYQAVRYLRKLTTNAESN
jgi:hypothetical protein